ncbi:MAG: hypothetical protein LM580_08785 [Thermofilum sp.]|nr:hypothetical protein [Thermofilum sp.]
MARAKWLPVLAGLLSAAVLVYAIYVSLRAPSALVSVPPAAIAVLASRRKPEVAVMLALVSLIPLLPPVDLLPKFGPIAPLKGGSP